METNKSKKILIAPLDWGLGHTTRCMTLVRHLKHLGHTPIVAGNQEQIAFITQNFHNIDNIHLEGYQITFPGGLFPIFLQVPKVIKAIQKEHEWLIHVCKNEAIEGIISDNRYGLFHPTISSVIITNQLVVQSGINNLFNKLVQQIHYKYLNKFNATWVADTAQIPNIGGALTHSRLLPNHTQYLGWISQFEGLASNIANEDYVLIFLSGPEPQRTLFSNLLWQQLEGYAGKVIFIEGKEIEESKKQIHHKNILHLGRLSRVDLLPLLQKAKLIICRSSYGSILDLTLLEKCAILIPTPGQTEHLYLGKYLHGKGQFITYQQNSFSLHKALKEAKNLKPNNYPNSNFTIYKNILQEWVDSL